MEYKVKDRLNNQIIIKESKINVFLYTTKLGRILLKIIVLPFISKIAGIYQNSIFSKNMISKFIKNNHINMNDYEKKDYKSFNDFFTRKIKEGKRKINDDKYNLISPCDAKLKVYKLTKNLVFNIKNSKYTLNDLIDSNIKLDMDNAYALVFRLCVDDYHRYSYIDSGYQEENNHIKGVLHTVRPIATNNLNVFTQNEREWTTLHTETFGDVIEIEVGALMVGKIVNEHSNYEFIKGEEKGYFKFGASTIILIINNVNIDDDILFNSANNIETIVKLGEKIGRKC